MPRTLLALLYCIAFKSFILYNDYMNIVTNILNQERLERIGQVPFIKVLYYKDYFWIQPKPQ